MNTSLILLLFFGIFLANFLQSSQAAKKKVYFIYGSHANVIATQTRKFNLGQTTTEDVELKQYLEIDPNEWNGMSDNDQIVFHVRTSHGVTSYDKTTVAELRDTDNALDFADEST
ncbi:hypothetical protein niasHT_017684 [Heterodera trifolii]|uniref:Uncharacterized protein n=1 Tax=Heterodera trifolii TaxID=157864 RepID=A0ABD2L884_9BILA